MKNIVQADKDDVGFLQLIVVRSSVQVAHVDYGLIVARTLGQVLLVRGLDFNIENLVVALRVDIKADRLRLYCLLECPLCLWNFQMIDFDMQEELQKLPAQLRLRLQDFAKKKIIRKSQVFPFFDLECIFRHIAPFPTYISICFKSAFLAILTENSLKNRFFLGKTTDVCF